jgi:hypothetical protein
MDDLIYNIVKTAELFVPVLYEKVKLKIKIFFK